MIYVDMVLKLLLFHKTFFFSFLFSLNIKIKDPNIAPVAADIATKTLAQIPSTIKRLPMTTKGSSSSIHTKTQVNGISKRCKPNILLKAMYQDTKLMTKDSKQIPIVRRGLIFFIPNILKPFMALFLHIYCFIL